MPVIINGAAGLSGVTSINSASASTPVILQDIGSNSNTCRAWASWVGSTGSIRGSFNVSSITDNGAGNYTVNFTTAMPDVNYSVAVGVQSNPSNESNAQANMCINTAGPYSSTQLGLITGPTFTNSAVDLPIANVTIFR
jgi:hypothetical protein